MSDSGRPPGDEIRAGDRVAHRYTIDRGHVEQLLDRVMLAKWQGQPESVAEPVTNLLRWA